MKLGIRLKLFLFSLSLIAIAVAAAEVYLSRALETQLTEHIRSDLLLRARLVGELAASRDGALASHAPAHELAGRAAAAAGARVTLTRPDGRVMGDSGVAPERIDEVENHGARPEIVAALSEGEGSSVRYSSTIERDMMYAAAPIRVNGVVTGTARVALPLTEVRVAISEMHRSLAMGTLVALIVAGIAALTLARITSSKLLELTDAARKMAGGDLAVRTRTTGTDEVAELGRGLDHLANSLSRSLGDLRAERDLLTGILSSMNEGVLVVGTDGRIVLTNPALRAMLLLGHDAVGKSVLQVVRNADLNALLHQAASGEPTELELEVAGLRQRRVLVRAVALPDTPGGALAVFVDVTELRRLEAVRRDFVANASHELRSPLTTIRAAAETLSGEQDNAKTASRFIELIQRNADRLAALIDDLLELSRIESRELNLQIEPLDLAHTAERIVAQHVPRAQLKRIAISNELSGAPLVQADRRALEHVFGNLIDNALKYCPEGAAVRIFADTDDALVHVSVADTGPGIPAEHLPRLFERFYRVDAGRSRELGGTGLGLSIVKHLIEALGGVVSVDSRAGAGTTFSFTLRRA